MLTLLVWLPAAVSQMARAILRRLELAEEALAESDAVIAAACRPWAHEDRVLQTIPGAGVRVAHVIVAETGAVMTRFRSAGKLAAGQGLATAVTSPRAGAPPSGVRHGNKWATSMLVEAAGVS